MTKEQVIAMAREAGIVFHALGNTPAELERFATLVRNAALEEAAQCMEEQDTQAPKYNARAIRAMKEPTT